MPEKKVNPIPSDYQRVIPYLITEDPKKLIEFLEKVFDGQTTEKMEMPDGKIGHAEIKIGDCTIMLSQSTDQYKPNPTMLYIYVEDVDAVYKKALDAGATSVKEPQDQFYGDRSCMVTEASGNQWGIASHVEDITPEEMQKRAEKAMSSMGEGQ